MAPKKDDQLKCSICSKLYSCSAALSRHRKVHAETSAFKFKCSICEMEFKRKDNFDRHVSKCINKSQKESPKFCCPICEKEFSTKQNMNRHKDKCGASKCTLTADHSIESNVPSGNSGKILNNQKSLDDIPTPCMTDFEIDFQIAGPSNVFTEEILAEVGGVALF